MKKHDEGYALVLVVLAIVVLSLLTSIIFSDAIRNLKSQQNSLNRMQDQYTLEGEIEKLVSQIKSGGTVNLEKAQWDGDNDVLTVTMTGAFTEISCELALKNIAVTVSNQTPGEFTFQASAETAVPEVSYISYKISSISSQKEGEGQ